MRGALATVLLWIGLGLAGLSLVMKLDNTSIPALMPGQEYWLAIGGFLALLIHALYCRTAPPA
jgi:hypothetical protein